MSKKFCSTSTLTTVKRRTVIFSGTPYFGAVRQIYTTYKKNLEEKGGLLFTTTDVAPSDYPHNNNEGQKKQDLIFLMKNERPKNIKSRKQGNVYISVVVFTDCEEDVEHLDDIRDLDPYHIAVTDDYVNERKEMLEIHGKSFKYSMVIILLLLLSVIIIIIVKYQADYMIQTVIAPLDPSTYKKYEKAGCSCVIN